MEYKFLRDYDDIQFAITWREIESTEEETNAVLDELEEEKVEVFTLSDLLGRIGESIESFKSPYNIYVDDTAVIRDMILNGEIDIIQTHSGYFVIEYLE